MKKAFFIILAIISFYMIVPTIIVKFFSLGVYKKGQKSNAISLTFDDGPNPHFTPQLLDLLKEHQIKATFFVVGEKAKKFPGILKRMDAEGHEIGVHNYKHISNWLLSPFAYHQNLSKSINVIEGIIGKRPIYYRPPWGHFNVFSLFFRHSLKVIMWSHISQDWKLHKSEMELYEKLKRVGNTGEIILLHDCGETLGADREAPAIMLKALELFIKDFKSKGGQFATVTSVIDKKIRKKEEIV